MASTRTTRLRTPTMAHIPYFTFTNGEKIPAIGMGCWMGAPGEGERAYSMCVNALKAGYRHFDTASGYANEEAVGRAIRDSGIPRNEIFITTKLPNFHDKVLEHFEESLKLLDCDYIDLYLMHWPQTARKEPDGTVTVLKPTDPPTIVETWKEMEKLLDTGKVKTIGVSNFSVRLLEELLPHCTVIPATNQIEYHPCLPQQDLREYCANKGILLTAYTPLGRGPTLLNNSTIQEIAIAYSATPAQVILSWVVQNGIIVVPKSENVDRMAANLQLLSLPKEQVELIDSIHRQPGMHKSLSSYHSEDGKVFGWTYEQLGWNFTTGGIVSN